jgi:hydroxymethylpyrimidine pyrophosphatase-like HAD family hydrolase
MLICKGILILNMHFSGGILGVYQMYKIVFFDIDGTLLNSRRELPKSTISAIHKLHDNGILTAIASARPPFNIQQLLLELNISSYVVYNGGLVVKNGDVIHRHVIEKQLLQSIQETVEKNHDAVVLDCEDGFVLAGENSAYVKKRYLERSWNIEYDKGLAELTFSNGSANPEVFQLELVCLDGEEKGQAQKGQHAFEPKENTASSSNVATGSTGSDGSSSAIGSYLVNSNSGFEMGSAIEDYIRRYPDLTFYPWISYHNVFNAVPRQVSKAYGIQKLMQSLGIDSSEAVAFGDGLNDVEMISHVGMGIAMGNGADKLKQVADFVARHVDEDGIEYGLKHLGLI